MSDTLALTPSMLNRLAKIREALELVGAISAIERPLTSPDGLRQSIELLLRLAALLGVDDRLIERLASILLDDGVFNIVLAIVQYVISLMRDEGSSFILQPSSFILPLPDSRHAYLSSAAVFRASHVCLLVRNS